MVVTAAYTTTKVSKTGKSQSYVYNHCSAPTYGRKARYGDRVENEMNFFEVIFVTVSWLLVAEPLARFPPRSKRNLEK